MILVIYGFIVAPFGVMLAKLLVLKAQQVLKEQMALKAHKVF